MDILKKIEMYREEEEKLRWEGSFADYLQLLKEKPWVAQSAHSRVYNMLKDAGITEEKGTKKYEFFSNQLFGLEESLERLVEEYFHPAAKRLDVRKRILLLMGPVSGGKSTLVTMLKRGLEAYSLTDR
ncbi:MAG: protein prkA, partial [Bacillus sp. (in: firmicutes)]